VNRRGGAAADLEQLADRLHSVSIRLLRAVREEDARMGISGPRSSALSVVVYRGPLTIGALAAAEQVRPPTMTKLVQALESSGLVERTADPADARRVLVRATTAGRRLLAQGRARRVGALTDRLTGLSAAARRDLERAVAALETVFGARG
jgi:DNA-binding MarR family transcriptional regulator